ncbi:MAG: hypothetical protein ABIC68_00855 [Candidatus Omnitrophota bacterium]
MKKYILKICVVFFTVFLVLSAKASNSLASGVGFASVLSEADEPPFAGEKEADYLLKVKLKPHEDINKTKVRNYAWTNQSSAEGKKQCDQWEFDLLASWGRVLPALVLDVITPMEVASESDVCNTISDVSKTIAVDNPVEIILLNPMSGIVKTRLIFSSKSVELGQNLQINLNDNFVGLVSCSEGEMQVEDLELSEGINIVTLFVVPQDSKKKEAKIWLDRESIRCELMSPTAFVPLNRAEKPNIYECRNSDFGGFNVLGRFSHSCRPFFLMSRMVDVRISDYNTLLLSFAVEKSPFESIKVFLALDSDSDGVIDRYLQIPDKDVRQKKHNDENEGNLQLKYLLGKNSINEDDCRIKGVLFAAYSTSTDYQKDLILEIGELNFFSEQEEDSVSLPLGLVDWNDLQILKDKNHNGFHYVDENSGCFVSYFDVNSLQRHKEIQYAFTLASFSNRPEFVRVVYSTKEAVNKSLRFYLELDKNGDGHTGEDLLIGKHQKLKNWKFTSSSKSFDEYQITLPKIIQSEGLFFSLYRDGSLVESVAEIDGKKSEMVVLDSDSGVLKLYLPKGKEFKGRYDLIYCLSDRVDENDSYVLTMDFSWLYELWPNVDFKAIKAVLHKADDLDMAKAKSSWSSFLLKEIGFFSDVPYSEDMFLNLDKYIRLSKTPMLKIDDEIISFGETDKSVEKEMLKKGILTKKIRLASGMHSYQIFENQSLDVENIILEPCKDKGVPAKEVPDLIFKRINPTKYMVDVKSATCPFWLVLSENFSRQWCLYQVPTSYFSGKEMKDCKIFPHKNGMVQEAPGEAVFDLSDVSFLLKQPIMIEQYKVNGFSNAWYIDPQKNGLGADFSIVIFFKPQAIYCLGLILSLSFFILALLILLLKKLFHEKF